MVLQTQGLPLRGCCYLREAGQMDLLFYGGQSGILIQTLGDVSRV